MEIGLDFYAKVTRDYLEKGGHAYICTASNEFLEAWHFRKKREKILSDAKMFFAEKGNFGSEIHGQSYLFFTPNASLKEKREIRLRFLGWAVTKYWGQK